MDYSIDHVMMLPKLGHVPIVQLIVQLGTGKIENFSEIWSGYNQAWDENGEDAAL